MRLADKLRLIPSERDELLLAAGFSPETPGYLAEPEPESADPPLPSPPKTDLTPPSETAETEPPPTTTAPTTIAPELTSAPATTEDPLQPPPAPSLLTQLRQPGRGVVSLGLLALLVAIGVIILGALREQPTLPPSDDDDKAPVSAFALTGSGEKKTPPSPDSPQIQPAQAGETLILVTEFVNYAGKQVGYNVAGRIREKLEGEIRAVNLDEIRVEIWPEAINRRQAAVQLGQTMSATLLIFGEYDVGRVVAQFALPNAEHTLPTADLTQEVSDLESLSATINGDLPEQTRSLGLLALGQIYLNQHEFDRAGQVLERSLRNLQGDPETSLTTLGTVNYYLGQAYGGSTPPKPDQAIEAYTKALEARPNLVSARLNRSAVYQARQQPGDLAAAVADLHQVINAAPDYTAAYNNRAAILMQMGGQNNVIQAQADLDKALTLDPTFAKAYLNRAILQYQQGAPRSTWEVDLTAALEHQPDYPEALNLLCWGQTLEGNADLGIAYCEQALTLDPAPNIYDSRGLAHALLGNTEQAIADFEVYISWLETQAGESRRRLLEERRLWVAALRAGESPFTPEMLAKLRNQ